MREIFENDKRGIDECDVVVASLNGIITDDGTAWELGYAYARASTSSVMHTDWRLRFEHEVVNLMIECSMHRLVRLARRVAARLGRVERLARLTLRR